MLDILAFTWFYRFDFRMMQVFYIMTKKLKHFKSDR